MPTSRVVSLLSGALLAALALAARADEAAGDRVQAYLAGLDSYSAAFEQTLRDARGEVLEEAAGEVFIERPGRFHWHYTEPYSQYLISDGRTLWVYDEDLQQVTVRDLSGSMDATPAAILGGEMDIQRHFQVVDVADHGATDWLELTPRGPDSQFQAIRLGFRDQRLAAMVLFDSLDQRTRIDFRDSRRNPELGEGLFTFEPPAGVDVIDSRQAGG